jgi:hypothetical protein
MLRNKFNLLTSTTAIALLISSPSYSSNPEENAIRSFRQGLPSREEYNGERDRMVDLLLTEGHVYVGVIDKEVINLCNDLYSLLPAPHQQGESLKAIYELSDHFGYNFWQDLCYRDRKVVTLVSECAPTDRLNLMHVLNQIFWPLAGKDKQTRELRGYLIDKFHETLKQDRAKKLECMLPLIHTAIRYSNNWDCSNLVDRSCELAKKWRMTQFKAYVDILRTLIEELQPIDGPWGLVINTQKAIEKDPDGSKLQKILPLLIPFFTPTEKLGFNAEMIPQAVELPEEDREDVLKYLASFNGIASLNNIIPSIARVHAADRPEFSEVVIEFAKELKLEMSDVCSLAEKLSKLTLEQRRSVCAKINTLREQVNPKQFQFDELIPMLSQDGAGEVDAVLPHVGALTSSGLDLTDSINVLRNVDVNLRAAAVARYSELLKRRSEITASSKRTGRSIRHSDCVLKSKDCPSVFSAVASFPADHWKSHLPIMVPIMAQTDSGRVMVNILETFRDIPAEQLEVVSTTLQELDLKVKPKDAQEAIRSSDSIYSLSRGLNPEQVSELPMLIDAMIEGLSEDELEDVREMVEVLDYPPEMANRRLAIMRFASPMLKTINYARQRGSFIEGLSDFPSENLAVAYEAAKGILSKLGKNHVNFIKHLRDVTPAVLPYFCQVVEMLAPIKVYDGMHLERLCLSIKQIASEELPTLVELLKPVLENIELSDAKASLLWALASVPADQRQVVLDLCRPVFANLKYGHGALVRAVSHVAADERGSLLEKACLVSGGTIDGFWLADVLTTMCAFELFKTEVAQADLEQYLSFLSSFKHPGKMDIRFDAPVSTPEEAIGAHQNRKFFLTVFGAMPADLILKLVNVLTELRDTDPITFNETIDSPLNVIAYLRSSGVIDVESLSSQWGEFMRTCPNKNKVKRVADFITRYYEWFTLIEDDEIVQQAIRTGLLLENSNDQLNPYRIYDALQQKRAEAVSWDLVNPSKEVLNGVAVQFNPHFLRDELKQYGLTYADLPKHSVNFLDDCINLINQRIKQDPTSLKTIQEITSCSFQELKASALADGILARYLSSQGKADARVPVMAARFIAIISHLETLSCDKLEAEAFSPREEGFLRLLASIQGCANGKSEGINSYYLNILPVERRYSTVTGQGEDDIAYLRSKAEVTLILLEEVEKMFSGQNHLMKALAGLKHKDEVQQASHQAGYLRNLIGHVVGLQDQQAFDAHTHTLYLQLVNLSKQDAVQEFFKFFTTSGFIYRVKDKYGLDEEGAIELLANMGILKSQK